MSGPLFTPTSARDLHRNLIEWWGSREAQEWAAGTTSMHRERFPHDIIGFAIDPAAEQNRLRAAETFLVTDDMAAVCRHAATTLPTLAVEHSMLPAEVGFMVFNDRLSDHSAEVAAKLPVEVLAWWPSSYDGRAGVAVGTYGTPETLAYAVSLLKDLMPQQAAAQVRLDYLDERLRLLKTGEGLDLPDEPDPELVRATAEGVRAETEAEYAGRLRNFRRFRMPMAPALFTFLPYGQEPPPEAVSDRETEYAVRMLLSAWLLMDQPIAAREHPRIYRPAAKRAVRAGLLSDLTVVMLRRPRTAPGEEPSGREYHRRWIVRGHWRRIPTPELPQRVTWVHGYVKGPADAPLVMTDRVTVLAR